MHRVKLTPTRQFKGKSGQKRCSQLMQAREKKRSKLTEPENEEVCVLTAGSTRPLLAENESRSDSDTQTTHAHISSSASKLRRFSKDGEPGFTDTTDQRRQRNWLFAECTAQTVNVLAHLASILLLQWVWLLS